MRMSFANWDEIIELCGDYSITNPLDTTSEPTVKNRRRQNEKVEPVLLNEATREDTWVEEEYDNMLTRKYGIDVFSTSLT